MSIEILSEETINQIAAGEVVERPSHLVKELVENSLDAGATEVEVEFDQGGRFVSVKDNGCGISENDLKKSVLRHATSKIKKSEDIFHIDSLGFRGEALASISAVSDFAIQSRRAEDEECHALGVRFGDVNQENKVGGEPGTLVTVKGLFENTPARLKFLKSETAEHTQIKNTLRALALSNWQVGFRIRHKSKLMSYWPQREQALDRVKEVLKQDEFFRGDFAAGENGHKPGNPMEAEVYFSSPNNTSRTSKNIWIFVNGRWVQDRSLQAALMDSYRSLLMHGEYPFAVIYLTCPSDEVDVNIHPAKAQVKFRQPSDAFRAVLHATRNGLEKAPWLKPEKSPTVVAEKNESFQQKAFQKIQFSTKSMPSFSLEESRQVLASIAEPEAEGGSAVAGQHSESVVDDVIRGAEVNPSKQKLAQEESTQAEGTWSRLQVLAQAGLTYMICQSDQGLVIVDQHAAHERVMFERYLRDWKNKKVTVQEFLVPFAVSLEADQLEALMICRQELSEMGFDIDQLGPEQVTVRSAPNFIKEKDIKKAIEKMALELVELSGSHALEGVVSDIFSTMACHSVIRAGQALSVPEMESLLLQMDEFPLASFCPHGRPVYVEYPFVELEKDFGRIV